MKEPSDYSILDVPDILGFVFYPRRDWTPAPPGSTDYSVPVDGGVTITCRFYFASLQGPSILYFHGNGEIACDYDYIAPMYQRLGLNLFVADYRGYGRSGGHPTVSAMMSDCHQVFRYSQDLASRGKLQGGTIIMGRSLGSYPAVELAASHPRSIRGLIIESAFASVARLLRNLGLQLEIPGLAGLEEAHEKKVRSITAPALVLHGDMDSLVPLREGQALFDALGSPAKRFVVIHGAGHNDIMVAGAETYFAAVKEFAGSA